MKYTFNDVMDAEFRYAEDKKHYAGVKFLQNFGKNITMKDYELHVSWEDVTVISEDGKLNKGWLKNMEELDFNHEFEVIKHDFDLADASWMYRKVGVTAEFRQKIFWKCKIT